MDDKRKKEIDEEFNKREPCASLAHECIQRGVGLAWHLGILTELADVMTDFITGKFPELEDEFPFLKDWDD